MIERLLQAVSPASLELLPPTDFFGSKSADEEAEPDGDQSMRVDLASDSFLNHAAKNLPATMLCWHYRSRSESLIRFSNWAFYDGRLLTVPDERLPKVAKDQATGCDLLLNPAETELPCGGIHDRNGRAVPSSAA